MTSLLSGEDDQSKLENLLDAPDYSVHVVN
jgi:hypothetical protein